MGWQTRCNPSLIYIFCYTSKYYWISLHKRSSQWFLEQCRSRCSIVLAALCRFRKEGTWVITCCFRSTPCYCAKISDASCYLRRIARWKLAWQPISALHAPLLTMPSLLLVAPSPSYSRQTGCNARSFSFPSPILLHYWNIESNMNNIINPMVNT